MSSVSKFTADRNQRVLLDLVSKPGNDVCADCKARSPRWASYNLGIFVCMNCASIHRKIGTHITKVKSLTMDAWSNEQVEVMKSIGNVRSNAKYNPNEVRHPPPANREESERDSELEKFIRWKYEFKRFIEKQSSKPPPPAKTPTIRAQSTPATNVVLRTSPTPRVPAVPTLLTSNPATLPNSSIARPFSASVVVSAPSRLQPSTAPVSSPAVPSGSTQSHVNPIPKNPVWDDIMSLASPSMSPMPQSQLPTISSPVSSANPYATNPFSSSSIQTANPPVGISAPLSFDLPNHQGNPFGSTAGQSRMVMHQSPVQGVQSPFAQPLQTPFPQATQVPTSNSYSSQSLLHQQPQQQQRLTPSSTMLLSQPQEYQQQPAPQSNPFVVWPQQTGFSPQTSFLAQPQPGFSEQPRGSTGKQYYGQWNA